MDQLIRSKQRFPRVAMTLCLIMALLSSACGAPTATEPPPPNATYTPTVSDKSTTDPTTSIPQATDTPTRVQTLPPPNDDADAPIRLANAIRNDADYMVMVEILARAGIHTISDTNGQPVQEVRNTPSVLMFSDYQAQNLAREAHTPLWAHSAPNSMH